MNFKEMKIKKRLKIYARQLNRVLPQAEVWFRREWTAAGMQHPNDKGNKPYGFYIPDVINRKFKYIIEIDEPYHQSPTQSEKDKIRDKFFKDNGYKVFRINAYDEQAFRDLCLDVTKHRATYQGHGVSSKVRRLVVRPKKKGWEDRVDTLVAYDIGPKKPFEPKVIIRRKVV